MEKLLIYSTERSNVPFIKYENRPPKVNMLMKKINEIKKFNIDVNSKMNPRAQNYEKKFRKSRANIY